MELLYRGFDGLDVSFAGQISSDFCQALEAAKDKAQQHHQPEPLEWNGVRMTIRESGARGGYAFNATTGKFGATWLFKKPNGRDPWGAKASCNSFNLATRGLGGARAELYSTLERLGFRASVEGESIARVDYAFDFLAPDFVLDPSRFVMHSHAIRSDHIEHSEITVNGRSGRVTSVTVGKMPGRQVIVYDKRAEVIASHKAGWWEIWNANRAHQELPPLTSENAAESRIWRVELRAGKKHLKDTWNLRKWSQLDDCFGAMVSATLNAVRYAEPTVDRNRSRWPESELWARVRQEAEADLFEMQNWAQADLVKRVQKEDHDRLLACQMTGLLTSLAALRGVSAADLAAFAREAGNEMACEIERDHSRFRQKLAKASCRFSVGLAP